MTTSERYLPFDHYFIAARIDDLTPDGLKKASNRVRDAYAYKGEHLFFQHKTALNHMAKTMGFNKFNEFKQECEERLPKFLEEHGLLFRRDVLAAPPTDPVVQLEYRQISDRLFASGRSMPKAIFTGVNTNCWDLLKIAALRDDMKIVTQQSWPEHSKLRFEEIESVSFDHQNTPPNHYAVLNRDGELRMGEITYFLNLIGNQLCDPFLGGVDDVIACIYEQGGSVSLETRNRLYHSANILRELLSSCPMGWVEVIPYNKKLCFLKTKNGSYNFVFRNLRSTPFAADLTGNHRLKDFPFQFDEIEQFEAWSYFNYSGWQERDDHLVETNFYERGGGSANYPGLRALRREHFKKTHQFEAQKKTAAPVSEFSIIQCDGKELCVSQLVTVDEFRDFMKKTTHTRSRMRITNIESWESTNCMKDSHLPAAATWHDAKAYAQWFGKINSLPVRLLTEEEYLAFTAELIPGAVSAESVAKALKKPLGGLYNSQGMSHGGNRPNHMDRGEFDHLEFRYDPAAVKWAKTDTGLRLLQSSRFGEWLMPEGAAINSLFFCSQYDVASAAHVRVSAERGRFSPASTGKYKGMKIGFRLVYEVDAQEVA